ncbi:MAG: hypothetical protein C0521_14690 [Xanthomonas sp.]|nr:hypothetical protein [Xanthomonas sp.]
MIRVFTVCAALLLSGCLVTPHRIVVPPVPVIVHAQRYEAFRILDQDAETRGSSWTVAVQCLLFADTREDVDKAWDGTQFHPPYPPGHEFGCREALSTSRVVMFKREGRHWQVLEGPVPPARQRIPHAVAPGHSRYLLCRYSDRRVMSLSRRMNHAVPAATTLAGCEDFVPLRMTEAEGRRAGEHGGREPDAQ